MAVAKRVLPGFAFSMGYTLFYLSLLVLIPLGALVAKTAQLTWHDFWRSVTDPYVVASYRLSFQASFAAALINSFFGLVVAWVLVRYPFPGRRFFDAIVDFPFALPTAVAGLTFGNLLTADGWFGTLGRWMAACINWFPDLVNWIIAHVSSIPWRMGHVPADWLELNNTFAGVTLMLTFVSMPFVIRTVQPVLQDWEIENEQAAASLGAGRWRTFFKVVFPQLYPAWLSGVALAFARSVGEYGSVIFVTGNIPGVSQIAPVQIMSKLEDYRYSEATAIGVVLLTVSLLVLLFINGLEWWARRHER